MKLPKIPQENETHNGSIVYAPVIKQKNVNTQTINTLLISVAVILFVAVLATYFVKELPAVIVSLRNITGQAVWVFFGGFAIGELLKSVAINKARESKLYKEQVEKTAEALKKASKKGTKKDRETYCKAYVDDRYQEKLKSILENGNVSAEEYEKYKGLNKKEIAARFPDNLLSQKQLKAILSANSLKRLSYNADFIKSAVIVNAYASPSELYNAERKNIKNMVLSIFWGVLGAIFGVGFASSIAFSFSIAALLAAVIKVVVVVIMISFKIIFGWNLVTKTEYNRLCVQESEAENYCEWYDQQNT